MTSGDYHLHNVVELEPSASGGQALRRFPRAVCDELSQLGRIVALESAGVEIRFVTDSDSFRISLGAEPSCLNPVELNSLEVTMFRGEFFHSKRVIEAGRVNHVLVTDIGDVMRQRVRGLSPEAIAGFRFAPDVWRVFLGRFPATLIELSCYGGSCRAPLPGEMPARRWLAYGSSITNGAGASAHHLSYIYHAARRFGVDVYNQGLSGSCLCESGVADYLAARDDWELITLEIGVNMRANYTPEEFENRAACLIHTVATAHPEKPVAVISIYPNADKPPFAGDPGSQLSLNQMAFDGALRRIVSGAGANVHLIEGADVLHGFGGLTMDMIHPGDYGHIEMGHRLAGRLARLCDWPVRI